MPRRFRQASQTYRGRDTVALHTREPARQPPTGSPLSAPNECLPRAPVGRYHNTVRAHRRARHRARRHRGGKRYGGETNMDAVARGGALARRRAHRRAHAGRLRHRPARRHGAARGAADLRKSRAVFRDDLPDLRAARPGGRRRRAARRPKPESRPATGADLWRRQDAYADRVAAFVSPALGTA